MAKIWCIKDRRESFSKAYGEDQLVIITELHLEWLIFRWVYIRARKVMCTCLSELKSKLKILGIQRIWKG
jgi:hypothetical protein